ncbi:aspartate-semialdehyde dehydrogenase [bacterium]|nr:aspartate-semialdehyde dehydrogenase [bacterium]
MKIGIVGATGEVGRMMLTCLLEQKIEIDELVLIASKKSAGTKVAFAGKMIEVEELTEAKMKDTFDYLLFSAGGAVSRKFSPIAEDAGNTVIDNSSAFRQDPRIPLVIPEINGSVLDNYQGIIANPNCSTIQMLLPLYAIHKVNKIKKIVVSTYQSVSGSGHKGINSLLKANEESIYPRKIEHNVIPLIGSLLPSGYSEEEEKMRFETQKIFNDKEILVSATTVRVPVLYGHSESIYIELENSYDMEEIKQVLRQAESVRFLEEDYITPLELGDSDDSFVCRLREGVDDKSLTFWNVANNIRVGAATNAVRILKFLINR